MITINDLSEIKEDKFFIFKHSISCGISKTTNKSVMAADEELEIPVYKIVIQDNKNLSIEIANKYETEHESPQLLLINNGRAVWVANHFEILKKDILMQAKKV